MTPRPLRALAVVPIVAAALFATAARADPSAADLASARQLFAEANRDEDAGRWTEALGKLRHVAEVRMTAGVRYHLALCEVNLGHLSAALEGFTAAQAQAQGDGAQDVLRLVGKQLATLAPRVPRLVVNVRPPVPGATVKVDGVPLTPAQLGTQLTLDPGVHYLEAQAEGHAFTKASVALAERDSTQVDLSIPELPKAAVAPATAPAAAGAAPVSPTPPSAPPEPSLPARAVESASTPPAEASGPSRTGALLASGGTLLLAGGGVAAFVLAGNNVSSGKADCAAEHTFAPCTSQVNTVRAWDFTAAGAWTAAAALAVVSVVLWAQGPSSGSSAALFVGPGSAGLGGRF